MKSEINREYYCSACSNNEYHSCPRGFNMNPSNCTEYHCSARHRKHPTPEQFKEEYGEEWNGTCYVYDEIMNGWYGMSKIDNSIIKRYKNIVCACTPFGKPKDYWRQ